MSNTTLVSSHANVLGAIVDSEISLASSIVNHLGGIAAFNITSDAIEMGLKLSNITGFKDQSDTNIFFANNRKKILATLVDMAKQERLEPVNLVFELCHKHRYPYERVIQCYNILLDETLADTVEDYVMDYVDRMAYRISLHVVTGIIEDYNRKLKFPF